MPKEEQQRAFEQRFANLSSPEEMLRQKRKERKRLLRKEEIGESMSIRVRMENQAEELLVQGFEGETLKDALKRQNLVEATCGGFIEVCN